MSLYRRRQLVHFTLVGACGFVVDAGLLHALVTYGAGPIAARAVSFPTAVVTTWLLHRRFTFAERRERRRGLELGKYLSAQIVSALLGLAVYTFLVLFVPWFTRVPVAAVVASAPIGMASSYLLSHYMVFTGERQHG